MQKPCASQAEPLVVFTLPKTCFVAFTVPVEEPRNALLNWPPIDTSQYLQSKSEEPDRPREVLDPPSGTGNSFDITEVHWSAVTGFAVVLVLEAIAATATVADAIRTPIHTATLTTAFCSGPIELCVR